MIRKLALALMLILVPAGFVLGAADGSWLKKVPVREHEKINPYQGQAEAIARNILEMSRLQVPTISVITGEGGSGGALALAVSDRVLILENALYFVITPESCAAIMWRDANQKQLAAEAMRIAAPEVAKLGCVDEIIREPQEGAHVDPPSAAETLSESLRRHIAELKAMPLHEMIAARQAKFRNIAQFYTEG